METITVGFVPTKNGNGVLLVFHSPESTTQVTLSLDAAKVIAMQMLVLADTIEKGKA
jgi:hypothetical protein